MPNSVTYIGDTAFCHCSSLTSLVIPNGVTGIGEQAFEYCRSLKGNSLTEGLIIPDSVTSIGRMAFEGCSSLTGLTIGKGVISIGGSAFYGCSGITGVLIIPNGVTSIGNEAFQNCSGLIGVLTIPDSMTSIARSTFSGCSGLTEVRIGANISSIGSYAFSGCTSAATFSFAGAPPSVDSSAFRNVKSGAIGTYTAEHKAEWEAVIGADGKWNGLIMKEIVPPPLTLVAESADWSSGSITLCCMDVNTSGTAHTYSLFYEDESGNLVAVEGENAVNVSVDANGNAHLTDTAFSSRLDGIKPVKYHVKDENGRVSEACVTRTRHGISVGLSKFDPSYPNTELIQPQNEAELFRSVMIDKGGIDAANMRPLINSDAKIQSISDEWNAIADKAKPGDVVFFYVATHGVAIKGQIDGADAIAAYDGDYTAQRLQNDLLPFTSSDLSVKVVLIIMTCHAEAMVRPYEWGNMFTGKSNILYVAATSPTNNAVSLGDNYSYSEFGEFFLNQGLELRQADAQETLNGLSGHIGNRDGTVDLLECAKYAQSLVSGLSDIAPSDVRYDGDKTDIMSHTPMVKGNIAIPTAAPSAPGLEWTVINEGVEVQVTQPANAKYCKVYYNKAGASGSPPWRRHVDNAEEKYLTAVMADENYCAKYSPLENNTKYLFKAIAVGPGGASPTSGPYEVTTGADNLDRWITFNAKGGRFSDGKAEEKYTRLCGSTIGELPPDPLRAGFKFIGWYMLNDGEWGEEARENTVVSHSVIYYARWEAQINCTVKLDVKGAPLSLPNIIVRAWEPVGELPEPQWQGHVFAGWFSESGGHGTRLWPYSVITRDVTYYAYWTTMTTAYLSSHQTIYVASNGDIATAAAMTAANGCRTVGECYALGIDPEDPNDDLRITAFRKEDGQPVITVNHTTDGSGNSFADRIRTLGKKSLMEAEWVDITDMDQSEYRFFKVAVELDAGSGDSPSANDDRANAGTLTGTSGECSFSTVNATVEGDEPIVLSCEDVSASVWFKWTAPIRGRATFSTVGSDFDTVLGVYRYDTLAEVAFNNDADGNNTSRCTFIAQEGQSYYVVVAGYGGSGVAALSWECVEGGTPTFTIEDGVLTAVELNGAFEVTIPGTVREIGESTFEGCEDLMSVVMSNGVKHIDAYAFSGCTSLESVTLSYCLTNIGKCAFAYCHELAAVTVPEGVTNVGYRAFYCCDGLTSVALPRSLTGIGEEAFAFCGGIESFTVSDGNPAYKVQDGMLLTKNGGVLLHGADGDVSIPSGVTRIANGAFASCVGLTNVTIPTSVTSISSYAFSGCDGLTNLEIPNSVQYIGKGVFQHCRGLADDDGFVIVRNVLYDSYGNQSEVEVPQGVVKIEDRVFASRWDLTKVMIPSSVSSIGSYLFDNSSNLTNVTFEGNAPTVNNYSFVGVGSSCTVYVKRESSGWGVTIPGTWNGLPIRYKESEE